MSAVIASPSFRAASMRAIAWSSFGQFDSPAAFR
jgi:hypothetical protein